MSPEQRLHFHQVESGPRMKDLEAWFKKQFAERKVEPNSGLGEAILYMQKYWDKLTLFLRQAGAPLDNNIVERTLKILHRKNALPGRGKWTRVLPTQMTFGLCVMVVLRPGYFRRLPPFTSRDGFQISLKILKVILCGDFLGFHIIHHLPERDSRLTGSTCQGELAAAI